jgi:hypothetical protein
MSFTDRIDEVDVMYLDVYSDGTYAVYGSTRATTYGSEGGSTVTEDGYVKHTNVKIYAKKILLGTCGNMQYYIDCWFEQNTRDKIMKAARNISLSGAMSCPTTEGDVLIIQTGTLTLSKTSTKATGRVSVNRSNTQSGTAGETFFNYIYLYATLNSLGNIQVSMTGV